MPLAARVRSTLRAIFHRSRLDSEMDAELRFHIDSRAADLTREGLPPDESLRRARLEFGAVDRAKEECRESQGVAWLHSLAQDLRFGARMLRKSPAFTIVAVLTLALGIGANTAIFSLVNSVMLDLLPVANPHELVLFSDFNAGGSRSGVQTGVWKQFSSDDYANFRNHNESFKDLTAYQTDRTNLIVPVSGPERAELPRTTMVAGNFFSFFGLHAAAGRLLTPEDDQPSAPPVTVLEYGYWTSRFHRAPSAIGQIIEVHGIPFRIVGVAPRGFSGVNIHMPPDFWTPLARLSEIIPGADYAADPHEYWLNIVARIKPGVKLRQAQAVVTAQLQQSLTAQTNRDGMTGRDIANSHIQLSSGAAGISSFRVRYEPLLEILAVIMGIVLLMACANVANLLLSRSAARESEISVRVAVGATRGRLIRQLLTESVLLASIGGAAGILLAKWGSQVMALLVTGGESIAKPLDSPVLAFSLAVTMLAGIFFGLAPALRAGSANLATSMKGSPGSRSRLGVTNAIVVFQVAGSMVLLVGAGLFVRTFQKLTGQALGFDEDHVVLVDIDGQRAGYTTEQMTPLYRSLLERFQAIPGVRSATLEKFTPLLGHRWGSNLAIEGKPVSPDVELRVERDLVGPRYFETRGIPILLGRDISPDDLPGQPLVAVINQTTAREYFPGENPIGKRFSLGSPFNPKESLTIVGVAADARYSSLRDPVPPMEFADALQSPDAASHTSDYEKDFAIRASGDPRVIVRAIQAAAKQAAPGLPVMGITLLKDMVGRALRPNRTLAELSGGFATLTMLLACIGLYGTLACRVSRRTQEIGIRIALGAQPSSVAWLVAREGLYLVLPGILLGILTALASTKFIASQLFDVSATDASTFAATSAVLLAVALAASYIPARRAMNVDPLTALRHE